MLGRCIYLEVITGCRGSGSHAPTYHPGLDPYHTTTAISNPSTTLHPLTGSGSWLLALSESSNLPAEYECHAFHCLWGDALLRTEPLILDLPPTKRL